MRATLHITLSLALAGALTARAIADETVESIVRNGEEYTAKLAGQPLSWNVHVALLEGHEGVLSVLRDGDRARYVLNIEKEQRSQELLRIIERDGYWYVTVQGKRMKYRPWEYPAGTTLPYLILERMDLGFVVRESVDQLGRLESNADGHAVFRTRINDQMAEYLNSVVAQYEAEVKRRPGAKIAPTMERQMAEVKNMLKNGVLTKVDARTGMLLEYGPPLVRTRITDFAVLDRADEREFSLSDHEWEEEADEWTAADLEDLIMISHAPFATKESREDPELCLMNVVTGRKRRIPLRGTSGLPICFSKDRKSVFVTGVGLGGHFRLVQVNLRNGTNRIVGGDLLEGGNTLAGDLSPDGNTLAVLHKNASTRLLEFRLCLVDLQTDRAHFIGRQMDMGFPAWLPDGKRLLIEKRNHIADDKPFFPQVALMDLDGQIEVLCDGGMPMLRADRERIFFKDRKTDEWYSCGLDGQEKRILHDGLKRHSFPTFAPDGKRFVMMRFTGSGMPKPVLFRFDQMEGKVISDLPGFFMAPVWK